jgi:hypothetical protein
MLVHARDRLSSVGNPSRITVRISSNPLAASGRRRGRRWDHAYDGFAGIRRDAFDRDRYRWAPSFAMVLFQIPTLVRESCGAGSKAIIKLSATKYVSSAMECIVRGVYETVGAHGSIYSARMQCSRAGRSRGTSANLIIEPGGSDRLLMGSDFNNLQSYRRCQSSKRTDLR